MAFFQAGELQERAAVYPVGVFNPVVGSDVYGIPFTTIYFLRNGAQGLSAGHPIGTQRTCDLIFAAVDLRIGRRAACWFTCGILPILRLFRGRCRFRSRVVADSIRRGSYLLARTVRWSRCG